jgi:hypothetical protein
MRMFLLGGRFVASSELTEPDRLEPDTDRAFFSRRALEEGVLRGDERAEKVPGTINQ